MITNNARQTFSLGKAFAHKLGGGEVIALVGELGSGKTTFVQGLAAGLEINRRVISPTFILMRRYELITKNFYHIDLYRLENNVEKEIQNLGLSEIWGKRENIMAIEWADKIKPFLPEKTQWIYFTVVATDRRKIEVV